MLSEIALIIHNFNIAKGHFLIADSFHHGKAFVHAGAQMPFFIAQGNNLQAQFCQGIFRADFRYGNIKGIAYLYFQAVGNTALGFEVVIAVQGIFNG